MTPEERAREVEIVEEDHGDMHVADWRVNREKTVANIAEAIRQAVAEETAALHAVIRRLGWRINHQSEDDAEACRQGRHGPDCGA